MNMLSRLTSLVLLTLWLLPAAHAQPVLFADPATTERAPGRSGITGLFHLDYHVPDGYAISGLETAETSDRPCRVGIMRKALPGQDNAFYNYDYGIYGNQQLDQGCPPSIVPTDWIPSRKRAGFFEENNLYVRAAAVCDSKNNNNERIKGLRVFGAHITDAGDVNPTQQRDEFARPNCGTWQSLVSCPDGKIATGIRAHFNTHGFVGLELWCSSMMDSEGGAGPGGIAIAQARTPPPGDEAALGDWADVFTRCKTEGCSAATQASLDVTWSNLQSRPAPTALQGQYQMERTDAKSKAGPTPVQIEQKGRQVTLTIAQDVAAVGLPAKTVFQGVLSGDRLKAVSDGGASLDLRLAGKQLNGTLHIPTGRRTASHTILLKRSR